MPCQSHKPGDECEDVCARSCYARKDGMSADKDAQLLREAADALMRLLDDTQHAEHADCEDGGYCPVRDARRTLTKLQSAIAAPALEERATYGVGEGVTRQENERG